MANTAHWLRCRAVWTDSAIIWETGNRVGLYLSKVYRLELLEGDLAMGVRERTERRAAPYNGQTAHLFIFAPLYGFLTATHFLWSLTRRIVVTYTPNCSHLYAEL